MREFGTTEVVMEGFGAIWRLVLGFGAGGAFWLVVGFGFGFGMDRMGMGGTVVLASLGLGRLAVFGTWTNRGSYGQIGFNSCYLRVIMESGMNET